MKRLLLLFLMLVSTQLFAGGGWPQQKGEGYFKLGQSWIISSRFYGPAGEQVSIVTNGIYLSNFYGEYGFTNRFTGIVYVPFFVRSILNEVRFNQSGQVIPGDYLNAIGDSEIGLKYGLVVDKPVVISATVLFGLPLGETGGGESRILQTGDGEFNQMIRLDASRSFPAAGIYVSAYVAYNNRTKNFSDEVRFGLEAGGAIGKFTPIVKLNVVQSLFNGAGGVAENGIFSNNTEYISPVVELAYSLTEKIGIVGSGASAIQGRNILASPYWSAGLYLKL